MMFFRACYRSRMCSSMFIIMSILGVYWFLYIRTGIDDSWAAWSDFSQTAREGHLLDSRQEFYDFEDHQMPYDQGLGAPQFAPHDDMYANPDHMEQAPEQAQFIMDNREGGFVQPPQPGEQGPVGDDSLIRIVAPPPRQNVDMQLQVKGIPVDKAVLRDPSSINEVVDKLRSEGSVVQQFQQQQQLQQAVQSAQLPQSPFLQPEQHLPQQNVPLVPTQGPQQQQLQQAQFDFGQQALMQPPMPQLPQAQIQNPAVGAPAQILPPVQDMAQPRAQPQRPAAPGQYPGIPQQLPQLAEVLQEDVPPPVPFVPPVAEQRPPETEVPVDQGTFLEPDIIFRNKAQETIVHPAGAKPLMPRIIHQFWDDTDIPMKFAPWVQSWIRKNPGWHYWFWSPTDVQRLIDSKYPQYKELYARLSLSPENRDNALRFFIIHSYGGIFADMDMECLNPLEEWVYNHECFLTEETREHAYLINQRFPANVLNSIMGCRPYHPFFAAVLHSLPEFFIRYHVNPLHATGSFFLDDIFRIYKSNASHSLLNSSNVEIIEPDFFVPSYDPENWDTIDEACHSNIVDMPFHVSWLCTLWVKVREHNNEPYAQSLTKHHWVKTHAMPGVVPKVSIIYLLLGETESK